MNDEQKEELEILESIYPEELEIINEDSFIIHINIETEPAKTLLAEFKYPPEYPECIPILKLSIDTQPPLLERKFSYNFNVADIEQIRAAAVEVAEESVGMPSVFSITSFIKERAEEMYEFKIKEMETQRLKELSLEEEKEQAKFKGTKVTKDSFNEWRAKFRAELGLDKPKERINGRYTGKEIFAMGLYKEDDELEELDNAVHT